MIQAKIRKQENSFVVTISREEMERLQLEEGDLTSFRPTKPETRAVLSPEMRTAMEASWERNEAVYRYLVDR